MANIDVTAILTAIREVCDTNAGTLRTISSTRFDGGVYEGLDDDTISTRAAVRAVFEPRLTGMTLHPASPPESGSLAIYLINVEVSVYRHLDAADKLVDLTRDTARGLAFQDGDVLKQALGYPGNLAQTSSASPTGLIGENVEYKGSDLRRFDLDDNGPGLIETVHRFTGFVQVTQATS